MDKAKVVPIKYIFSYEESPDFEDYYVHGAVGSVGPYDLTMKFFRQDLNPLEKDQIRAKLQRGEMTEDELMSTELVSIREFIVGLTMSVRSAEEIGKWLLRKVEEHKRNIEFEKSKIEEENNER